MVPIVGEQANEESCLDSDINEQSRTTANQALAEREGFEPSIRF